MWGEYVTCALLVVKGLEFQPFRYYPALFLVAGPVFFFCLPYFSQSALCGGVVCTGLHKEAISQNGQSNTRLKYESIKK
eukprot:497939-Pelagomonas_calceolata.AAC.1